MATGLQILQAPIAVYSNAAALAADQQYYAVGQVVALQSPPQLLLATQQAPLSGQYVAVQSSPVGNTTVTTYWIPFQTDSDVASQSTPFFVRATSSAIAAYTGSGLGTLTGAANGALASMDTVALNVGDQFLLPAGLTNVSAVDSGPWVVVSLGSASTKFVISRPYWWLTGNKFVSGAEIRVGGEGAVYQNTTWKATAAAAVIDSVDPKIYCKGIVFQATLTAGTLALPAGQPQAATAYPLVSGACNCPIGIYSATKTQIGVSLAVKGGTVTGTVSYGPANASSAAIATAGYVGTAAMAVFALATAMATQTGDTSIVQVSIDNFL